LLRETELGRKGWCLAILFDCSALNWDHGLVDCGTNIHRGCWLFWQNEIQVYCWTSSNIFAGYPDPIPLQETKTKREYDYLIIMHVLSLSPFWISYLIQPPLLFIIHRLQWVVILLTTCLGRSPSPRPYF
jgi:hypothetical protein